ncbi:MAG: hypothetical protein Q3993_04200 [Filifactor alocis]|nr:hypothetical protein [Filifactor alocis]
MQVFVTIKQVGKRKNAVEKQAYDISGKIETVEDLIRFVVTSEVERFNRKEEGERVLPYLTSKQIEDISVQGKISFGADYSGKKQDLEQAIENACLSYEDGIYRIFVNEEEAGALKGPLSLKEGDVLSFVRLTLLAGRMW